MGAPAALSRGSRHAGVRAVDTKEHARCWWVAGGGGGTTQAPKKGSEGGAGAASGPLSSTGKRGEQALRRLWGGEEEAHTL